jgi:hypothetical protein
LRLLPLGPTQEFKRRRAHPRLDQSPRTCRRAGRLERLVRQASGQADQLNSGFASSFAGARPDGGVARLVRGGHLPACAASGSTTGPPSASRQGEHDAHTERHPSRNRLPQARRSTARRARHVLLAISAIRQCQQERSIRRAPPVRRRALRAVSAGGARQIERCWTESLIGGHVLPLTPRAEPDGTSMSRKIRTVLFSCPPHETHVQRSSEVPISLRPERTP